MKSQRFAILSLISAFFLCGEVFAQTDALPLKLLSPDRQLEITFALNAESAAHYSGQMNFRDSGESV